MDLPDPAPPASTTLAEALARHQVTLPPDQASLLERYCRLLWEWNEKLNLTRHTDFERFVARDVADSLAIANQLVEGEDVLDVGTGGGVPGIILAIVRPDVSVSLAESVAKKARAVGQIVQDLGIPVPVHHARAEALLEAGEVYDTLVVRAVARLEKLLGWFAPHWGSFRRLLVVKGPAWVEERQVARERRLLANLSLRRLAAWTAEGSGESVLLELRLRGPEDDQSP